MLVSSDDGLLQKEAPTTAEMKQSSASSFILKHVLHSKKGIDCNERVS